MVDISKLLTVAACAKKTTLSEPTIRARLRDYELKETRLAGNVFIHEDDLEAYLHRHPEFRA